jgi:hypothetical protein
VLYENGNIRTVPFGCKSARSRPAICAIGFSLQKSKEAPVQLSTRRNRAGHKLNKSVCRYDTVPFTWSSGPLTVERVRNRIAGTF